MYDCSVLLGRIILYDGLICWSDIDDHTTNLIYDFIRIQETKNIRKSLLDNFGTEGDLEMAGVFTNKPSKRRTLDLDAFAHAKSPGGSKQRDKISAARVS